MVYEAASGLQTGLGFGQIKGALILTQGRGFADRNNGFSRPRHDFMDTYSHLRT